MLSPVTVPYNLYQQIKPSVDKDKTDTSDINTDEDDDNHGDEFRDSEESGGAAGKTSDGRRRPSSARIRTVSESELSVVSLECEGESGCQCRKGTKDRMRDDLDICVCNPVTDHGFTTYEIKIQTINPAFNLQCSHTRRRYNDFSWLRKILKDHHPMCVCPELPAKKNFSERFEPQFIVERMKSLEDWIFSLLDVDLFFSDTTVHLFLQTNLTCSQMEAYTNGRLSSAIVRKAYKACKLKHEHSFMRTMSMSKEPPDRSAPIDVIPSKRPTTETNNKNHPRSDSGIPSSNVSSDNDSSYESQNGDSSSPSDLVVPNGGIPKVTEISNQDQQVTECESMSCDSLTNSINSSLSTSNLPCLSDYDIINSPEKQKEKKKKNSVRRVEMGVLFSINSE